MLDRFVTELEDDEVADMTAAGVDVPKSINQLLKLNSDFFHGENAPAHYFRGLNQDIIKGTTSCKAQPVLSVLDMKAALMCWMDMLTMMEMDVNGENGETDGCLKLLTRKVGALRSDHGVSSRAVVIADYVLPVFQLFMACFTEHPDAYYNKSFTSTRAPRFWNIIRYADVTLMPEDLLPCEKTAARGAIQCFNRTKAKGVSPDACFADHKRVTEKLSTRVNQQDQALSGFTDQCATQIKSLQKKMEGFVSLFQQAEQAKLTELKVLAKTGDIPEAILEEAQNSASAVKAMALEFLDLPPGIGSVGTTKRRKLTFAQPAVPVIQIGGGGTTGGLTSTVKNVCGIPFDACQEIWNPTGGDCNGACIPMYIAAEGAAYSGWGVKCLCGQPIPERLRKGHLANLTHNPNRWHPGQPSAPARSGPWWTAWIAKHQIPTGPK